jgi:hypothetical protein
MAVGPKVSVLLEHAASVTAAMRRANRRIVFIDNIMRNRRLCCESRNLRSSPLNLEFATIVTGGLAAQIRTAPSVPQSVSCAV